MHFLLSNPPTFLSFFFSFFLPLSISCLIFLYTSLQGTMTVTSMLIIPLVFSVDGGLYFCEAHNNLTILSNTVQSKQAEISVISRHL